jgi:hypothetical protein
MNAQIFFQQLSADEFQGWFQSEVTKLHRTSATRSMLDVMGARFRYAIAHCDASDGMPAGTRRELTEIARSVMPREDVTEPFTYAEGCRLLQRCVVVRTTECDN